MSSHRKKSRKKTDPGQGGRGRSRSADDYRGTIQEEGERNEEKKKESNNEKLLVALRIRPLKHEESARGYKAVAAKIDSKMVLLSSPPNKKEDHLRDKRTQERQYVFDVVFGPDSTQEEVYNETTKHLVENVLNGYNATVFAYGATGGGKTYTMVGTPDNPGIMVRALNQLFGAMESEHEAVHKVTMSYLEIYNENIRDLLSPSSGYLELRDESKGKNIQVSGLSEIATRSAEEVMRLLQRGNKERTQEPTAANKTSSRSHALLMVNVKQTAKSRASGRGGVKTGRLYMIDLAGSERAANTKNAGLRLKEGAHINRSLLALGNCINALAEKKTKYVNYRDSKLTRLLKDTLNGNCHTVMIAHISPADRHRDESRNTLVYADRAKNISNKVRRNVLDVSFHVTQYQSIISELKGEIGRLKEKINIDTGGPSSLATKQQMEELKILRDALVANFREQMKLRHRLMEIDNHILSLSMEFEKQNIIVTEWETEKAKNKSDRLYEKRKKRRIKKRNPKIYLEPDTGPSSLGAGDDNDTTEHNNDEENEDNESGFEDNLPTEEDTSTVHDNETHSDTDNDDSIPRIIYDNSESDPEMSDTESIYEPEEVKRAWEELMIIQREQQRYTDIKQDISEELDSLREEGAQLENDLPQRISTAEEKEILSLLCKVHELEIDKVEMKSEGLLKEHEVRRRDLLILKYDKQRSLCDEIIVRQQKLIQAMEETKSNSNSQDGSSLPMPPELMELYSLYQQELNTRQTEQEVNYLSELNTMLRSPSMLSLRGPEFEEKMRGDHLPPIHQEQEPDMLFQSRTDIRQAQAEQDYMRSESRLSLTSPESSDSLRGAHGSHLPSIESDREDSARSLSNKPEKPRKFSRIPVRSGISTPRNNRHISRSNSVHLPPIDP